MKKYVWILVCGVVAISCNQTNEKTAYVNNTKIVSEYLEMKEAQDKWTKRNDEVRAELEGKAKEFQQEVQGYQNISKSMSKSNREKKEQELMLKQQNLQREQQAKMQEIQKGSQDEIDSIIKKVKNFVKDYGKSKGYTYIFGETEAGNIFYAKDNLDITEEVLAELNKEIDTSATK